MPFVTVSLKSHHWLSHVDGEDVAEGQVQLEGPSIVVPPCSSLRYIISVQVPAAAIDESIVFRNMMNLVTEARPDTLRLDIQFRPVKGAFNITPRVGY